MLHALSKLCLTGSMFCQQNVDTSRFHWDFPRKLEKWCFFHEKWPSFVWNVSWLAKLSNCMVAWKCSNVDPMMTSPLSVCCATQMRIQIRVGPLFFNTDFAHREQKKDQLPSVCRLLLWASTLFGLSADRLWENVRINTNLKTNVGLLFTGCLHH